MSGELTQTLLDRATRGTGEIKQNAGLICRFQRKVIVSADLVQGKKIKILRKNAGKSWDIRKEKKSMANEPSSMLKILEGERKRNFLCGMHTTVKKFFVLQIKQDATREFFV